MWLRRVREKADLTQAGLAERIGVTSGHVSKLESGDAREPTYDTLYALSAFFKTPVIRLVQLARTDTRDSDAPGAP